MRRSRWHGVIAGGLIVLILLTAVAAHWSAPVALARVESLVPSMQHLGGLGFAVLVLAQTVIAASGVLPASLLGVAAGALYGLPLGFAFAAAGTVAGAELALIVSRTLFRSWVVTAIGRRPPLRQLDEMIARNGWRFVCLLRISPVMPFAATSYALGATGVSVRDYTIGTVAALPPLLGYVALGVFAHAGLQAETGVTSMLRRALLALGAIATLLLTLQAGRVAVRLWPRLRQAQSEASAEPGSGA